jgi:hypothetical protein
MKIKEKHYLLSKMKNIKEIINSNTRRKRDFTDALINEAPLGDNWTDQEFEFIFQWF